MRLSRPAILNRIQSRSLLFDPPLEPEQVDASSIDLRLGTRFIRFDQTIARQKGMGADVRFDVANANWDRLVEEFGEVTDVPNGEAFELPLGRLVMGWTQEYLKLPNDLAGRVEGKSRLARLGLMVHITAPTLQVGWEGNLQLEFYNVGAAPLLLRPGARICQIILEEVTDPSEYQGQFQRQHS